MIVCHCNGISDREIHSAIDWMRASDATAIITPGKVYRALGKRPDCGGCLPLFLATMEGNPQVIEYLNRALRSELTAVNQYWLHYRLQEDWGLGRLAKKSREESIEEMHHADRIITRIIFLEGHPNLQKLDPLRIGQTARETLEADLAAELEAVALYREAYSYCDKVGDYVSKKLFQDLLMDEEGHTDFLETQLGLLDRIGHERYELLNAEPANEADSGDAGSDH